MGFLIKPIGSIYAGEANAAAANYNAQVAKQNSIIARQQGQAAMEAQSRDTQRTMGRAIAAYGASGVSGDTGSPMDVLADSARMAELDRLTIQYNSELKATGYEQQASLDFFKEKTARTSGYLNAAGDLYDSASKAAASGG